jgi:hypothetical protein
VKKYREREVMVVGYPLLGHQPLNLLQNHGLKVTWRYAQTFLSVLVAVVQVLVLVVFAISHNHLADIDMMSREWTPITEANVTNDANGKYIGNFGTKTDNFNPQFPQFYPFNYRNIWDGSLIHTKPFIEYGLNQAGIDRIRALGIIPTPTAELVGLAARIGAQIFSRQHHRW